MDWDKLRVFHAAAHAGSFTKAGETLDMSQSAVSRQVSAIEQDLNVPLFHRHARGLMLTEQGELLYSAASEMQMKLESVQSRLQETRDRPSGTLRVTTTVGLGSTWLAERVHEFVELYPDISLQLILENEELDLSMRQADAAIRLQKPSQPDLIQRKLFTVHYHIYASPEYLERFGEPKTVEDLDNHRIVTFGVPVPQYLRHLNWLEVAGRNRGTPRRPALLINNVFAIHNAVRRGAGIAALPDYLFDKDSRLVRVLPQAEAPSFATYFVYPSELRNSARIAAFRDFLLDKAATWAY
ncbi:MAG: LysR family transcriptional regulator [Bauldia sp.]|nr:LysR family transcriptional regulator [Bauldia sp.]MCW5716575.1 LysR family transcriptional regulator [Bauldia sp.]